MSVVTDMILMTELYDGGREGERPCVEALNRWLLGRHPSCFVLVSEMTTAKAMQSDVFVAAINFLEEEEFIAAFNAVPWASPESVQLLLKREQADKYELIEVAKR